MTKNHDAWMDRLSDYLDDELADDERIELETHLARCSECRDTLTQLRAVRDRAGALTDRMPERDLWPGIATRVTGAPSPKTTTSRGTGDVRELWKRRFAFSVPQLVAAALVVAVLGGGSALMLTRRTPGSHLSTAAAGGAVPEAPTATLASYTAANRERSDAAVDRAIADLEAALKSHRDHLDPATKRVLDRNLATIDSALAQIRQALREQPTDPYLNHSLTSTMLRKLDVLQVAVRLAGPAT